MPTDPTMPPADAPRDGLCGVVSAPEGAGGGLGVPASSGGAGGRMAAPHPTLTDHMGRPLYEAVNAALAQGQSAERLLARIQQWADGPCPTRPAAHRIEGDRASGYVQAMDEIGQLLAGHGPLALDAR